MKKTLGILGLLIFVVIFTAAQSDAFLGGENLTNLIRRTALFGGFAVEMQSAFDILDALWVGVVFDEMNIVIQHRPFWVQFVTKCSERRS